MTKQREKGRDSKEGKEERKEKRGTGGGRAGGGGGSKITEGRERTGGREGCV